VDWRWVGAALAVPVLVGMLRTSTLHGEVVRPGSQERVDSVRTNMNAMLVTVIKRLGSQASANEMDSLLRGAKRAWATSGK